jgi:hypothetical protein
VATGSTSVPVPIAREASAKKQLKKFLSRNFYLCMSLVMAGFVVWGFSRTVDRNLLHSSTPKPALLWFHGAVFSAWIVLFIAQSTLVRVRKVKRVIFSPER